MASTYALPGSHSSHHSHDFSTSPDAPFPLKPFMNGRPRGRPRGESDLGRPSSRKGAAGATFGFAPIEETPAAPSSSSSWFDLPEALTALLLPLPYLFASLAYPNGLRRLSPGLDTASKRLLDETLADSSAKQLPNGHPLLHACALCSVTLISVGLISMVRSVVVQPLDRRKSGSGPDGSSSDTPGPPDAPLSRILAHTVGLLLPFYATLQIGGTDVALCLLVSVAAGLGSFDRKLGKHSLWDGIRRTVRTRKATCAALLVTMVFQIINSASTRNAVLGSLALATSILAVPPPLPTVGWSLAIGIRHADTPEMRASLPKPSSPLISNADDTWLTLTAGAFLGLVTILSSLILSASPSISNHMLMLSTLSVLSAVALTLFSLPSALRTQKKVGLAMGCLLAAAFGVYDHPDAWQAWVIVPLACVLLFSAVCFDTSSGIFPPHTHDHSHSGHKHSKAHAHHLHGNHSKLSAFLIARCTPGSILHSILIERDSRRIAYFGVLNLAFMLVQFFYGYVSGSLGLLTDSIHMLFDCAGLAVGLAAAVMSKWRPNARFPYGFGKVDTLSGFANGVFLMLVSVEIIFDAFERLWEGHEIHRLNELLVVSILGFLVNIVGLTAFGHAHHGHSHGDGDHDHHHHDNENMQGIFLHILADALGSVAVIISTLLTKYYGWSGWDPIASCIIAVLIFVSAIPLVKSSAMRLLLSLPADVEYGIRETLQELSSLRGVVGYAVPKFWLEDEGAAHAEVHAKEEICGHSHSRSHSHSNGHAHNHANGRGHKRKTSELPGHHHDHGHDHDRNHNHDHDHGHSHTHTHSHSHSHSHGHGHDHDHDHGHTHRKQKVLGAIHIIASRAANPEDVRERTVQFLKDRGMDVVVHVEKEGEGRCWCGGGNKVS